jgi:predicted GIY-YIG superfamily endonuclease
MAWVYLLQCADCSLYVGATADLAGRVADHQAGKGGAFTSRRRPVALVHSEEFADLQAALVRERQIKRWTLQKKQALIRGDIGALRRLAKRTPRKV